MPDQLEVSAEVIDYLAEHLDIADPACLRAYSEPRMTRFEDAWEIRKAIFDGAVAWLRERRMHATRSHHAGPPAVLPNCG